MQIAHCDGKDAYCRHTGLRFFCPSRRGSVYELSLSMPELATSVATQVFVCVRLRSRSQRATALQGPSKLKGLRS